MSFSQFKNIAEVQKIYQIKYEEGVFIDELDVAVPPHLIEEFKFNKENIDIFSSEASRSELIISPLLREIYKRHNKNYSFWIQKSIAFDEVLTDTPDYIFSKKSALGKTVLETPIIIVVEAKKNDFEQGWGQCLAQLVASQKINNNNNNNNNGNHHQNHPIYGIVTDGNLWQFANLLGNVFTINERNYTIDHIQALYGALEYIADTIEKNQFI